MNQPNLQQQVVQLSKQLQQRIDGLAPNDPVKDWFSIELDSIHVAHDAPDLPLEEANARMQALKQLGHLIFQHCVRIKNPDSIDLSNELPDSLLTVEARMPANVLESTRQLNFSIEPSLLHEPTPDNDSFDPVSPTAKIVGYLRSLDRSLQVSEELSQETQGESLLNELGITDSESQAAMAVLFQSRYHAFNAAIAQSQGDALQVIEFAAGISPRGIQWSNVRPGTIYIESDLPQLMIHKAKLIRNSLLKMPCESRGVLHCCAADVLDRENMFSALQSLDTNKPFTMVTEGLLLYFGQQEMEVFFGNVSEMLNKYPQAVWVTDLVAQSNLHDLLESHPGVASGVRSVFSLTGREVVPKNPFENEADITSWLARFGLNVDATVALADATPMLKLEPDVSLSQRLRIVGDRKIWRIGIGA